MIDLKKHDIKKSLESWCKGKRCPCGNYTGRNTGYH